MKQWGRRIRGALVMGVIWAAAWAAVGWVPRWVFGIDSDLPFPFLFGALGFISGVTFSALLVLSEGRRRFEQMSLARFAAWGATDGLLLSGLFVVDAALRGAAWWRDLLVFGPSLATAGAVCAAGTLAVARKGERQLVEAEERELLGNGD